MTDSSAKQDVEARIRHLEEALAEYAACYGLTDRARALLTGRSNAEVIVELGDHEDNRSAATSGNRSCFGL